MKKTSFIILAIFSLFFIQRLIFAEGPGGGGQTPPIIPGGDASTEGGDMNPPVLPDNGDGDVHENTSPGEMDTDHGNPSSPGDGTNSDNIPGMPGGGTQNTGALNSGPGTDSTAGAASPQSGSSQLSKCSNIRFLSLLDILIWLKCIIVVAIIPLIFALAFMFFLWGVMRFIMTSDPTKRKEGKAFIIGGLIGLFVMTSIWGIIKIVSNTLGTGSAVPILQTSSLKKTP